ncbi:MAG: flagellar biosynthesis anti-sigma factor FlgM [Clostridium sp.]|nr:flagellar biosynthesis anti-sigma factor FlgM [Clostridium sp.]
MDVRGVGSSKEVSFYQNITKNNVVKDTSKSASDSLEISNAGKELSAYSIDDNFTAKSEKIDAIKNSIENGTYNVNSKLIAQKMLDHMKGTGI